VGFVDGHEVIGYVALPVVFDDNSLSHRDGLRTRAC
jgi:hypothetical protein